MSTNNNLHPLWNNGSFYRLARAWTDDGVDSIRHFFVAASKRRIQEEWGNDHPPDRPAVWGMGEEINQQIHQFFAQSAESQYPVGQRTRAGADFAVIPAAFIGQSHPELLSETGVFTVDVTGKMNAGLRRESGLFTGCGMIWPKETDHFFINVDHLPDHRQCLTLLVTPDGLGDLATLQKQSGEATRGWREQSAKEMIADDARAVELLQWAVDARTLDPNPATPEELRLARRVGCRLALMPGAEGVTQAGAFRVGPINLGRMCPGVLAGSVLLVVLGAAAPDPLDTRRNVAEE